ncbi:MULTISPECIES: LysM peptidoglycan-binding domain-containing protein [unclassified Actinomyces]|nr:MULTISPECIES: LysM peptidoglycan-binding domain-containing protein [unclassified Actinomyces]
MRWAVVSMMVVVLLALAAAAGIIGSGLMAPAKTSTTTVQPGQSLWDVAAATGAADVSEAMAQIVDLNGLDSSTIHPGQSLVVPAH